MGDYPNEHSHYCLFCYKTIEPLQESTESLTTIKRFISQINRYTQNYKANAPILPVGLLEKLSPLDNLLNCCNKCQDKVEGFCEKYEKFKILEMELDWKLDELAGEINYANKVPARFKMISKILEKTFKKNLEKKTSGENTIRKFRQCIVNLGQQRRRKAQPRVLLNRNFTLDQELILKKTAENIVIRKTEEAKRKEQAAANKKFRQIYKDKICPKCGKKLLSFRGLQLHFENHKDESQWKFECDECGRKFSARNELKVHQRTHTGLKPYKCPYCKRRYRVRKSYTGHLKLAHADEEDLEAELKRKIMTSYKRRETIFEEKIEKLVELTTFPDDDNGPNDIDLNLPDGQEICTSSHVTGTNNGNNAETFKDPLIQIKYEHLALPEANDDDLHSLEDNVSTATSIEPDEQQKGKDSPEFKCPKCGKCFTRSFGFKTHLEKHKPLSEWKWKCAECNRKFATRGLLRHHMQIHLDQKALECQYCHKKFDMKKYLMNHIRRCHKTADSKDKTKNLMEYLKQKPYKCNYCEERYGVPRILRNHLRKKHSNENIFELDIMKNVPEKMKQKKAALREEKQVAIECEICTRKFTSLLKKKLHFKICHDLKGSSEMGTLKCDQVGCTAYFLKPIQLKFHLKLEHKGGKGKVQMKTRRGRKRLEFPKCEICGIKCSSNYKLKIHMAVHTKEKKFKCRFCEKQFAYLSNLTCHVKEKHENEEKIETEKEINQSLVQIKEEYSDDLVNSEVNSSNNLENEIRVPEKTDKIDKGRNSGYFKSGRKKAQYQCQYCDQSYRLEHNLTKHLRERHSNEREVVIGEQKRMSNLLKKKLANSSKDLIVLECEICTRKFNSLLKKECHFRKCHEMKGNLEGEIFKCEENGCKAYFLKLFQLRYHRKLEHGDESEIEKLLKHNEKGHYECPKCKKVYNLKNSYDLHLSSHRKRDEWEFGCEKCGKRFLTKAYLKLHMRVHTKEKGYECKFCGKKFGYVCSLGNHLRAIHGDEEEVKVDAKMKKLGKKGMEIKVKIKEECDDVMENKGNSENYRVNNGDNGSEAATVNFINENSEIGESEEEDKSESEKETLHNLKDKMANSDDNTFGRRKESFGSGSFIQLEDLD